MNAIATDPEVGEDFCRKILSVLLQKQIGKIRVVSQRAIPASAPEYRGIRLDVEVEELLTVSEDSGATLSIYDIEPHNRDKQDLVKRNRFYQAKIDSRNLKRGEKNFSKLPNLYIISITNYDPFGKDYMMYTFHNKCDEVADITYEDGLHFIYFNTKGNKGGNEAIGNLLKYIQDSKANRVIDDTTRELHEYVSRVRVRPEVRLEYMRFDEIIEYERMDTIKDCIRGLLEEYGEIPESFAERLRKEYSEDTLKQWLKLAAKVKSIDEFIENIEKLPG